MVKRGLPTSHWQYVGCRSQRFDCVTSKYRDLQPRPQAFLRYRVTEGGLEPLGVFPPSSSGNVTFDCAPRTTRNEAA